MTKWDHRTVYDALVARGERQKASEDDKYVKLYNQDTNCAVLYPPESSCDRAPVHLNPLGVRRCQSWDMKAYQKIRPHISPEHRDSKLDPEQDFVHYSVTNWNGFADALGLQPST